jgi:hypothetical protein
MVLTGILFVPKETEAKNNDDFVIKNGVLTEYTGFDNNVVISDGVKKSEIPYFMKMT